MLQRTFALYGDERAIENVMRSFTERGYGDSEAIYKASELIDRVKLSHRMMHMARDLSGGEKTAGCFSTPTRKIADHLTR